MPILKKILFAENLERYKILVEDTDPFSKYFKITELKDTFTGGKNAFLIQGSPELVSDTLVKIEIKDSQGNVIYHEPGMGIPEYFEGTSKVISVYVYPDTSYGPCTITILGELSEYDNNGITTPVPPNWEGQYNIRWQKNINVNPALPNTTKIRFYNRPNIDITEIIQPLYNRTAITKTAILGTMSGVSVIPDVNTNYRTYNGNIKYQLSLTGGYFSSSMVGETITVNGLPQPYTTTIATVINQSTATATIPYYETASAASTDQIIKNFTNKNYSISYTDSVSYSGSFLSSSYAQIVLTDLETFTGDANRIKIYAKSLNQNAGFKLLQDFTLESTELLLTSSFGGDINVNKGTFRAQSVIDQFWTSSLLNTTYNLTASFDNINLASSVKLIVTSSKNTTDLPLNKFTTKDTINFLKNTEYTLEYTPLLSASLYTNNKIEIYASGSAFIDSNTNKLGKLIDTINANGLFQRYDLSQINFKPDQDGNGKILFVPYQGQWQLADISLRASQETFFSPNQIVVNVNVPTVIPNETFDFKFEFYDINNNLVYPLSVEKRYSFRGGNDTVVGTITILDGSISSLSSSVSGNIAAVSSSISGTMTVYSSSASSSVGTLSGSVSASITALSSSMSQSNATVLSSSLSKVQQLADGGYSGSFISGSIVGDKFIFSPVVGGVTGYFSEKFQVGKTNPIILDASTATRKIYVGTGTYNNTNTSVYMDSGGQFSLKNKLTFDGDTLSVTGNINISGGDAATKISNAALSGSNAQLTANGAAGAASTAQSTADTAASKIFTDAAGKIIKAAAPTGKGLFLDSTHLGFYNTTDYPSSPWRTYMTDAGNFYLAGSSTGGLSWDGTDLSIDGNITARNGTFYGNITSNATISGGTISGGTITGGTITGGTITGGTITGGTINGSSLNGATGTFTGTITASGGTIGSWTIDSGNLRTANSRMILNPTAPSITLNDANGNAKTTIRTGALQGLTSQNFLVGYFTITSPDIQAQNQNLGASYTYSGAAQSLGPVVAGLYNASYSYNYTVTPGTIVQVDAYTSGQASYSQGINILDGSGNIVGAFGFGTAQCTNYVGSSTATTNNMYQSTGFISITMPSDGTYYARPWYSYIANASGTGKARILSKSSNTPSLTFTKVSGFSELTDEGLQIVSSTSRYIKMQTGGVYDLMSEGSWYHTGGDVALCTFSGVATVNGAKIAVQGGTYPSDERLKEDISNFTNGLDTIKKLNPKWFRFKDRKNDLFDAGVIAQDVQPSIPEFIGVRPDGFFGVNYDAIHMTMVNAIKELSNKIDELEAKIRGSI